MDTRSAGYGEDLLLIFNLIEDDVRQPGTSELAQFFVEDTLQSPRGFRVGDSETLPDANVFADSAMRTDVGYALIVRRSDMQVIGAHNEFSIDALFAQIDEALAGPQPAPVGELEFSRCAGGPFQPFEACAGDEQCIGDATCNADVAGDLVCTPQCSSENIACAGGATCVLGVDSGICVQVPVGEGGPPAATCDRDSDCARGLCLPISSLGRSACRVSCEAESDCDDGYTCDGTACVLASRASDEPEPEPEGCAQSSGAALLPLLSLLFLLGRRRRLS